ncbi:MAG: tryptophan-rich sensory protein [Ruminococcus sp.]|nr:tryptophan-rich sensory protein [Ruminococcus sp.]
MKGIKWTELLIFVIGTELVGALSALIAGDFSSFYSGLNQPPLAPPGIVFPIVWTILYALMGISAYLIYDSEDISGERSEALGIYAAQLFVNFMWSIVFFRFEKPEAAAVVIILLAVLVAAMILKFRKISPAAAYLNIPYLLWVIFAAYLNIGVVVLN